MAKYSERPKFLTKLMKRVLKENGNTAKAKKLMKKNPIFKLFSNAIVSTRR